jgi:hypothetical protein
MKFFQSGKISSAISSMSPSDSELGGLSGSGGGGSERKIPGLDSSLQI